MEKRLLGKTNFEVSIVGFGGIPIQRVDKDMTVKMLEESLNQGINFIDTARGYTISEELIGSALKEIGRERFILATKSLNRTYEGLTEELHTSLKLLSTEYIDLYQLHNVATLKDLELVLGEGGAMQAVKDAKAKGLVKEIGISSHSKDVLDKAIETGEFSTIQFPYNAIETQGEPIFEKAKKNNIGVIIMKPLAGGALTNGELALRFILENPNVTVVIPGMDSIEQVIENASVGNDRRAMKKEEREELEKEAAALGTEFCRRCGYCAPCSVGMDIPFQFILDSYYTRYNLQQWATDRYKGLPIKASDCIECGLCLEKCPYNLPIVDMLKKVASHY